LLFTPHVSVRRLFRWHTTCDEKVFYMNMYLRKIIHLISTAYRLPIF
jgi:hypothetical protein